MSTVRIQTGATEPIEVLAVDSGRNPITGLSDLKVKVRRLSDGYYFDWNDDTFRACGAVTQLLQALDEVNATCSPGEYRLDTVNHVGGFDTSQVANPTDDDIYRITVIQDGGTDAVNFPQIGEIKVGDWVDYFDQAISDNATPAEVQSELQAIRLHQLVSVNPGAVTPGAGTYIKQILDSLDGLPRYVVLMTFSYNEAADRLDGVVWVESGNLLHTAVTSCTVYWQDIDGNTLFTMTDAAPDASGFFKVQKASPSMTEDSLYKAKAEVTVTGYGTVSGGKGNFTF